jgi:hypothetical protein
MALRSTGLDTECARIKAPIGFRVEDSAAILTDPMGDRAVKHILDEDPFEAIFGTGLPMPPTVGGNEQLEFTDPQCRRRIKHLMRIGAYAPCHLSETWQHVWSLAFRGSKPRTRAKKPPRHMVTRLIS